MPAKRRGAKKKPSAGMSAAAAAAASASPDRKKLKSTRGGPDKPPSADISAKAQTFKELFCPGARIGVISMDRPPVGKYHWATVKGLYKGVGFDLVVEWEDGFTKHNHVMLPWG